MDKPRILKALAVSLLSLLLFGTVLGAAQAGDEAAEPAPFSVAFPRPGDRAEYAVESVRVGYGIPGVDVAVDRMVAEWLPASSILGSDGAWHAVRSLRVGVSYTVSGTGVAGSHDAVLVAHHDLQTGEVVAMERTGEDRTKGGVVLRGDLERGIVGGEVTGRSGWLQTRTLDQPGTLCGFDTPMHDRAVKTSEKVWLGPCSLRSGDVFVHGGQDEVDGVPAVRYQHRGDGDVQAWYNPGHSLPLRLRAALVHFIPSNFHAGLVFDARLVEAAAGTGSYTLDEVPGATVAPARLAPRGPLGPSTAGVDQPLPLAQAVATVRADDQAPTLESFLRRNPDAYLATAFPHQYADEYGRVAIDWFLLWTDGHERLAKFVRQAPERVEVATLGLVGQDLHVEDAEPRDVPEDVTGFYPPPDRLPDRLPTVAEALRLHAAHGGRTDAPLYWGFTYGCEDGCATVTANVVAGVQQRPRDATPPPVGSPAPSASWLESYVIVDADGRVTHTVSYAQQPVLPAVAPGPEPEPEAVPAPEAATVWSGLTPAATTGAGLAALLAGLAYYFWPHLKLAAAGLFSRIRSDRVLDHPQRARVDELVRAQPGIHFQELAREAGIGRGATEHHLRKLCEAGRVVAHVGAGYTCYFPKGAVDRRVMAAAPVLKSDGARAVLREVVAGRASSVRAVADAAGMGRSTVSHHLKRLRDAGLVEDARPGYRATGHARAALAMMA